MMGGLVKNRAVFLGKAAIGATLVYAMRGIGQRNKLAIQ